MLAAVSTPAASDSFAYRCADGRHVTATYLGGTAPLVHLATARAGVILPLVPVASGTKYAVRDWVWWTKATEARLRSPAISETICHRGG